MVEFEYNPTLTMGGLNETCAYLHLYSIGRIDKESNKKTRFVRGYIFAILWLILGCSGALGVFINKHLAVDPERYYVFFNDYERENVGWNGSTFATD